MEGLIHGGAYFRNFTVWAVISEDEIAIFFALLSIYLDILCSGTFSLLLKFFSFILKIFIWVVFENGKQPWFSPFLHHCVRD